MQDNVNDRLKIIRKDLNLTQQKFADRLGLSRSQIATLETGANTVTKRTINDICEKFNVNLKWLETGEDEMYVVPDKEEQDFYDYIFNSMPVKSDSWKELVIRAGNLTEEELRALITIVDTINNAKNGTLS